MQLLWNGFCPWCQTDYSVFLELRPYQRVAHCLLMLVCLAVQWVGLSLANLDGALDGSADLLSRGFLMYAWGWFGAMPGMLLAVQHFEFRWRNREFWR